MSCTNHSLESFINQYRINKNDKTTKYTHTGISYPRGSFHIPDDKFLEFMDIYHDSVFVQNKKCGLIEQHIHDRKYTPIRIDLDFKHVLEDDASFDPDNLPRLYTSDEIKKICEIYINCIKHYYKNLNQDESLCFIMEKEKSTHLMSNDQVKIKDGVHIMFPYICVPKYIQIEFRNMLYKLAESKSIFSVKMENTYSDIFDLSIIKSNGWLMYGSQKEGKSELTYKVTRILSFMNEQVKDISLKKYTSSQLVNLLSIRNKTETDKINPEVVVETKKWEKMYDNPECKKNRNAIITEKNKTTKEELELIIGNPVENKKGYIDCLSLERCKSYNDWLQVGWALYNIDNCTGQKMNQTPVVRCLTLRKWMEWSRQPGSGYENEPEYTYINMWLDFKTHLYGVNIGSLKMWAREDSQKTKEKLIKEGKMRENELTEYEKIREWDIHHYIEICIQGDKGKPTVSTYDIAVLMRHYYRDDFKCVSNKDNTWFYYDKTKHRWYEDDRGMALKSKISTEIWKLFNDKGKYYANRIEDSNDKENERRRDNCYVVAHKLKNTTFKSQVMTECNEKFYDISGDFMNRLDNNKNLIGFNNGVYDLSKAHESWTAIQKVKKDFSHLQIVDKKEYERILKKAESIAFRKGNPDDYISLSTNINYSPISKWEDSSELQEINEFIAQVITNPNVRNYLINFCATCISGSTKNEKFHVWSGSGGNGKSKLIELLDMCLGNYTCKMSVQNLTSKRSDAGAANPELARTKGKRFLNLQEPDEKCKINVGLMKELTGGDELVARQLYKEPVQFKPQFKMVLTCNQKPELPPDDEGTWRRVILIEFNSKFRIQPKGTYKNYSGYPISIEEYRENRLNGITTDYWEPEDPEFPEFPINEELNENFSHKEAPWVEPFMSFLINQYGKNIPLVEPEEVLEYINEYRMTNDIYQQFLDECIQYKPDSKITAKEISIKFKEWKSEQDSTKADVKSLLKYMNNVYKDQAEKKNPKNKTWIGLAFKDDEEEESGNFVNDTSDISSQ